MVRLINIACEGEHGRSVRRHCSYFEFRLIVNGFFYKGAQAVINLLSKFFYKTSKKKYSRLIILSGPPRSGTTWLNRELCNSANMYPFLPECTLLTQQVELYNRTVHYCEPKRFQSYFCNDANLRSYYKNNVEQLINLTASINFKPSVEALVLKDPELCLYLDEIKELFPPHKLLILVRDPRDVLASIKNVTVRKNIPWDVVETSAQFFNYYYRIESYQKRQDKDSLVLRYEDLVSGKMDLMRNFLEIPVFTNLSTANGIRIAKKQLDQSSPFFSDLYLKPTTQEKVGSYRETLSAEEILHIESVYSGVIHRWGY